MLSSVRLHHFIVLMLAMMWLGFAHAEDDEILEGFHYQRITNPAPVADASKVTVAEHFWYGCPHCYQFEPHVKRWLQSKPDHVTFRRVPSVLNPSWGVHARAYFTAEVLGVADQLHEPLFQAIQVQKRALNTREALQAFFKDHGVDEDKFLKTFRSFPVATQVNRSRLLGQRYGLTGVPSVVINGKYRTSAVMAGSYAKLIKVINHLVDQEAQAQR